MNDPVPVCARTGQYQPIGSTRDRLMTPTMSVCGRWPLCLVLLRLLSSHRSQRWRSYRMIEAHGAQVQAPRPQALFAPHPQPLKPRQTRSRTHVIQHYSDQDACKRGKPSPTCRIWPNLAAQAREGPPAGTFASRARQSRVLNHNGTHQSLDYLMHATLVDRWPDCCLRWRANITGHRPAAETRGSDHIRGTAIE